ncbi:MAG: 23S rRNA (guanosine(2251)-2'-O)-methyltransferase RlmB [Rhizobiaceae bacterium]|nr:23S rRNA (guanosine(2251)-2'-O)-methyltransferase RlmB [Rhizobiaceae bacterium]
MQRGAPETAVKNKSSRHKTRSSKVFSNKPHSAAKPERLRLFGIHTLTEALNNPARKKHRLLVTKNAFHRLEKQIANSAGLEIFEVTPRDLDNMVGGEAVHQGAVLECDPLPAKSLDELQPGARVVILDQISDPHNVGAIMRSCVAMGVEALVTTVRSSAPQTAILAKSASGALDLIDLIEVSNLSKAISNLNSQGYQTIGLDSEGPRKLESSIDSALPVALVLGAEGRGLRQKTRETCSTLARLDMPGKIKSLNVSNAAALALYIVGQNTDH